MVGLRALVQPRFLYLDEIADMDLAPDIRARSKPCIGADNGVVFDRRALDMAERADIDIVADGHAGAEHHVLPHRHVAPQHRIGAEPDRFGISQRHPFRHPVRTQALLHRRFRFGEAGARIDAHYLVRIVRFDDRAVPPARAMATMSVR